MKFPANTIHLYYFPYGDELAKARKEAKLSQRELALLSKLSHGQIAKIELGSVTPSLSSLEMIGTVLEIRNTKMFLRWINYRKKLVRLKSDYPLFYSLISLTVNVMNEDERGITINRFERRLECFAENEHELATNVKNFLLGALTPKDKPKNGLRPLYHYFANSIRDTERWDNQKKNIVENSKK